MNEMDFLRSDMQKLVNENGKLLTRVAELERDCAELSSQLSENMCGHCDRKMNGEIYVSDLETEIQQQQQQIAELEKLLGIAREDDELQITEIQELEKAIAYQVRCHREDISRICLMFGSDGLTVDGIVSAIQQQQQTIERLEAALVEIASYIEHVSFEFEGVKYVYEHRYLEVIGIANNALTHKTGGEK